ncbi:MAG: hypothetical protein CMF25_04955 [Kangiellaceae bacterium]|jgi:hypothetical protein|nr:hypothetical protein [Kangiellaceae bacterium]|tara:strand:+ start:1662 stop:1952 length:291 start_codon:yes stop_codon:yes gene_type:complete
MKKISMMTLLIGILGGAMAQVALADDHEPQAKPRFNAMVMCLYEDKAYSVGSRITIEGSELECVNADPDMYKVNARENARWMPSDLAIYQQTETGQ